MHSKMKPSQSWFDRYVRKYWQLHLLIFPGLLFFLVFKYLPMYGIIISMKNYRPTNGFWGIINAPWVGFKHFEAFFNSMYFSRLVGNTLNISLMKLIFSFPAPILLALLLNELRSTKFKRVTQTIVYLPHFLSWIVLAALLKKMFSTDEGPIKYLMETVFHTKLPPLLRQNNTFVPFLVGSDIYKSVGWGTIVYLAAITHVNEELYDAAYIDGATRFQRIIHVTLPGIMEIIAIFFILRVGGLMGENFDQIFNLYSPAVYASGDVLETYVYRLGLQEAKYSFASAVGVFQSVTALVLVLCSNALAKRLGTSGLW